MLLKIIEMNFTCFFFGNINYLILHESYIYFIPKTEKVNVLQKISACADHINQHIFKWPKDYVHTVDTQTCYKARFGNMAGVAWF